MLLLLPWMAGCLVPESHLQAPEAIVDLRQEGPPGDEQLPWQRWPGEIFYARVTLKSTEGSSVVHLARFDPEETAVRVASRKAEAGGVYLIDPKRYFRRSDAVLAVNATPFATDSLRVGGRATISGLSLESGEVTSSASRRLWAFALSPGGALTLLSPGTDPPARATQGAGGFYPLVIQGIPRGRRGPRDARTAIGVDSAGRIYLAVVDGPRRGHSVGATTRELGRMLARLGVIDALNLDGGGSSILLGRPDAPAGGRVTTVNRPIGGLLYVGRRPVANLLLVGQSDLE